jgi:glycosyltransferase involved in cell wall biosynthesis
LAVEPVAEAAVEPVAEPAVEPVAEPAVDPIAALAVERTREQAPDSVADLAGAVRSESLVGPGGPAGSVVIPAHNEQSVIADCLAPLAALAAKGVLEIVVVCNGCTDSTAEVAGSFAGVRVVELAIGSKPAALRAGDRAVSALPRIYLDADVVLPPDAARRVLVRLTGSGTPASRPRMTSRVGAASQSHAAAQTVEAARAGGTAGREEARGAPAPLAARPPVRYDATGSTALVRRYFRARARIPAVLGSLWGAGTYALSAEGRARFDEFPDLVADDLWVDQLFAPGEVEILDCAPVTVTVPARTGDLLTVLRRTYRGKAEHRSRNPGTAYETAGGTLRDLGRLARSGPSGLIDATVYLGFVVSARILQRLARNDSWERDDSSRAR